MKKTNIIMRSSTYTRHAVLAASIATLFGAFAASAQVFTPNDIVVSASIYGGNASTITVGQTLPSGNPATADGSYPNFTNNDSADGNFGITSNLSLIEINPNAPSVAAYTYDVTAHTGVVTSFTSKSEGSLNLSTDGNSLTIMGYDTGGTINQLDISNSNTPGDLKGTTYTTTPTYRAIAQINNDGSSSTTDVNTYAGDNPRAAVLTSAGIYTVGNSGDKKSANPLLYVGAQLVNPSAGNPGTTLSNTTTLGSYNITQDGYTADTTSKDNNFRGLTVANNTLYVAKGSGGNGIDTVYQVGTAGTLPTGTGNAIHILPGFNTLAATNDGNHSTASDFTHPFGLFFANATTLYVGDEGAPIAGVATDIANYNASLPGSPSTTPNHSGTGAGGGLLFNGQEYGGLDKYSLVGGVWKLDYVLAAGLKIGQGYTLTGTVGGTAGSYTVNTTAGLRDIAGQVNTTTGTVTIFADTSTASGNADPGADPNQVVEITDNLNATDVSAVSGEAFTTADAATYGEVYRGVALAPGSQTAVPEPGSLTLAFAGVAFLGTLRRRRQA